MKYQMLLWPHANARYRAETLRLAAAELRIMLDVLCPEAVLTVGEHVNTPSLTIETTEAIKPEAIEAIRHHSLMYALFEVNESGLLKMIAERSEEYLGEDLPAILKYKGKTNELFLKMLINVAIYASDYADMQERIEMLDPMCGRGTSVFTAVNYGWNATGSDIDRNDLAEAVKFLKRYLEYHRFKFNTRKESRTVKNGKAVPVTYFTCALNSEAMKQGDTRTIRFGETDAGKISLAFGKEKFHVIAADLPYGVQHGPKKGSFDDLLCRMLPSWRDALKPGGTIAVSFNTNTIRSDKIRKYMQNAGLTVLTGGAYDGFSHWVEQAVTRDIAVARK